MRFYGLSVLLLHSLNGGELKTAWSLPIGTGSEPASYRVTVCGDGSAYIRDAAGA